MNENCFNGLPNCECRRIYESLRNTACGVPNSRTNGLLQSREAVQSSAPSHDLLHGVGTLSRSDGTTSGNRETVLKAAQPEPPSPRTFQQTSCPKCQHRFAVEVLGLPTPPPVTAEAPNFLCDMVDCLKMHCGDCRQPLDKHADDCPKKQAVGTAEGITTKVAQGGVPTDAAAEKSSPNTAEAPRCTCGIASKDHTAHSPTCPRSKCDCAEAPLKELAEMPDEQIDTSDIPEVTDWSKAERGKFHRGTAEAAPSGPNLNELVEALEKERGRPLREWRARAKELVGIYAEWHAAAVSAPLRRELDDMKARIAKALKCHNIDACQIALIEAGLRGREEKER